MSCLSEPLAYRFDVRCDRSTSCSSSQMKKDKKQKRIFAM